MYQGKTSELTLEILNRIFEERMGWRMEEQNGYLSVWPSNHPFHGAASITTDGPQGRAWVNFRTFPVISIPFEATVLDENEYEKWRVTQSSRDIHYFLLSRKCFAGISPRLRIESGFAELDFASRFPTSNLSAAELQSIFAGIFWESQNTGFEVIGRFGGKFRGEAQG